MHSFTLILIMVQCVGATIIRLIEMRYALNKRHASVVFFLPNKQEPSLPYQILEVLKFENVVKFEICSLAFQLYNNPSTVPAINLP